MNNYSIETKRVFEIFSKLTKIPRGSQNMNPIADFCVAFAEKNKLKFRRDGADNVVIFKPASKGRENGEPVILQGHLDMVCQQTSDSKHDFKLNGPQIVIDGDFIRAKDTTLGADNGIAVAIIMTVLESDNLSHPPIEAVFTTDEEIGMIGAIALEAEDLKGKRFINLDSEDDDTITVSCAGGSEFQITLPAEYENYNAQTVTITLKGLKGGHSGVEIDKGRVNANILMGRVLSHLKTLFDFKISVINGGDKSNAITPLCSVLLCTDKAQELISNAKEYLNAVKNEIIARESDFTFDILVSSEKYTNVFTKELTEKIISLLVTAPNGVMEMSAEIEGLVETSLNLGILKTDNDKISFNFALRSNKKSALKFLEQRLTVLAGLFGAVTSSFGHYPPWEYKPNSELQALYCKCFEEHYGFTPKIEAIHAGLECGVFSSKIEGLDCIAVGPQLYDVHTVNERLSISSTENFTKLLLTVLEKLN